MKKIVKTITAVSLIALTLVGCGKSDSEAGQTETRSSAATTEILGAGATFPFPLYSKMFSVYNNQYGVRVNYQSIGSGGGVRQITAKTVDFGASDKFLNDEKLAAIDAPVVHIPTCLGAVVVSYNLPNGPTLNLTSDVVSDIFLGNITKWNDAKIQELNEGVTLPGTSIIVVHRSDASGTSAIFTDYLTKVNTQWANEVGAGKSVEWPAGIGAKGNEGVAGNIQNMPGAIGYIELAYAIHNDMPQALIQNQSGNFIKPELASISAAAQGEIPADTRITLTNSDAENGYPIASFTWLLLYKEQNYNGRTEADAEALVTLVNWMITDGQKYAEEIDYAPLPDAAREKALAQLGSITYNGVSVLN